MPLGAWDVEDDLRRLLFDGAVRVEELAGNVGEDASALDGDFFLDKEEKETGQKGVDLGGIGEVVEAGGERGGRLHGIGTRRERGLGVFWAEGLVGEAEESAAHAIGEAVVATSGVVDGIGVSGRSVHFGFLWSEIGSGYPRGICINKKTKELLEKGFVSLRRCGR
jgi:hypothetical protein